MLKIILVITMVVLKTPLNKMFKKTKYIWYNGQFLKWDDAKVHITTHALHYASLVFEGIRAYKARKGVAIFRGKDHIKRLFESAKIFLMDIEKDAGYTQEDILEAIKQLLKKNEIKEAYIRPIVFRDYTDAEDRWGFLGLNPLRCKVSVAIITFEFPPFGAPNFKLVTVPYIRPNPMSLPMMAKASANYLISQLASIYATYINTLAEKAGYLRKEGDSLIESFEGLLVDDNGFVTEGPGENIFMVKDGIIYTPPVSSQILRGITRDSVMKILQYMGYRVVERNILLSELYIADEVFMTGTAAEIKPVVEIDFRPIGDGRPGEVTKKVIEFFRKVVRGEVKEFEHWLDYID